MIKKIAVLIIVLFSVSIVAQQSVKIKPILGKHSYSLYSTDVGYGIKKYLLCLDRLPERVSEFYLPSNLNLEVAANLYIEPSHSGKIIINSQKSADGFLFVANGPSGNNFHLHLKKSASLNSQYSMELNLTRGNKYSFTVELSKVATF